MPLGGGLMSNDVLRWKAIGAAVWAGTLAATATAVCGLILSPAALLSPRSLIGGSFSPSVWLPMAAMVYAQAPAFVGAALALRSREPSLALAAKLLHWPGLSGIAILVSKLMARLGSMVNAARTAAFLGLHTLSACLFLSIFSATKGASAHLGASWTLQYAVWLSVVYFTQWAYWSQDVLAFPSVQRHRYFRIKQRLPGAAAQAAKLACAAFVCAAATALLRARALGRAAAADNATGDAASAASGSIDSGVPLSLAGGVVALLAGSVCTFAWLMSCTALEVVFTERMRPDDYSERDVLGAMAACLTGKKGELMQGLALHDASLLASDVGRAAVRREDMFADDSGDRWRPVAAACIAELDELSAAVAAALQQQKPAGRNVGRASAATQSHKWNVLPSALSSKGGLGSSRQQLQALLAVRCGYPRAALAAQALVGFACASLKEDRFGILQLTQPGLCEVLLCLLGALGAARQLMRATSSLTPRQLSLGPWRGNGDAAAWAGCYSRPCADAAVYALQDTLTVVLYRACDTFGDGLLKVLADCKGSPVFGSTSEAAALLQQFLSGQA